jgi:glyoxylate/hydroxypyruvate reductase
VIVAFYSANRPFSAWAPGLTAAMPWVEWRDGSPTAEPGALGDPAEIEAAIVWRPPPGWLAALPNLKLILSQGAGTDHIFNDPTLPRHIPVLRLIDPAMTRLMVEYVTLQVLRLHLQDPVFRFQQQAHLWRQYTPIAAAQRRVGLLGLGTLGTAAASSLLHLGFPVAGWTRRPKAMLGIQVFSGPDSLAAFVERSDILVCLLPLTQATTGIMNRTLFERLPRGAAVVNAGRGGHLVEADLLAALDAGQIGHAVLDVFETEPLPPAHPFWEHAQVTLTPHVAAITNPVTAARVMAENLRRLRAGDSFPDRVDPAIGY